VELIKKSSTQVIEAYCQLMGAQSSNVQDCDILETDPEAMPQIAIPELIKGLYLCPPLPLAITVADDGWVS
jgi:hypothetical protein